ncbi:MAG TPA: NAD-dependent epimerase/dehydratase family protein [Pirellulales bacterium]|jgi:nucleoside-diphosphate-sugar epimerase|nr:NAD-dependent epimerase/dehydratase family protein [Pirellulales bacterium]
MPVTHDDRLRVPEARAPNPEPRSRSRWLVTGAAGFIGSNVCRLLLDAGHEVVGLDNVNSAYDPRLKQWRLRHLTAASNFRFEPLDITDFSATERLFEREARTGDGGERGAPFAAVLNLAARAGVRPSVADPWVYSRTNSDGTLNLLELCRRFGVKKFVLSSTSSLYGAHNAIPFAEDADTNRPLSPYAASKKAAEAIAFTYHHLHGLDVSILRYFTVYGPAGRPDMSVFRFMRKIAEGEPITVFGDGSQQRDFSYVDDIARGTVAAIKPLGFEVINLGGDRPIRLDYVIDQIATLVGRKPTIQYRPAHPADVPATWANVAKARQLLDWMPQVAIEEGLRQTADWYCENRAEILPLDMGE